MIIYNNKLVESDDSRLDWMSSREKWLKKWLKKLLWDDGKGHHHAKYAKRLEPYGVSIVPIGQEPLAAAISFDEATIYVNEGFLVGVDPTNPLKSDVFQQLNVILRHELAHNLLMHQIRMINHLKDIVPELNLRTSGTIHTLLNDIEDFEISNKKYSAEDKETIKTLWINGKTLHGLITEEYRFDWQSKSIEQMYEDICAELDRYNHTGEVKLGDKDSYGDNKIGNVDIDAKKMYDIYRQAVDRKPTNDVLDDLFDELSAEWRQAGQKFPDNFKTIFDTFKEKIVDSPDTYTQDELKEMIADISASKAIGFHDVLNPTTGELLLTLYTPEERAIAIDCLNVLAQPDPYDRDFKLWYKEVKDKLDNSNYTDEQIQELYDLLKK